MDDDTGACDVLVGITSAATRRHACRRQRHWGTTHPGCHCGASYFGGIEHARAQTDRSAAGLRLETTGGPGVAGQSGAWEAPRVPALPADAPPTPPAAPPAVSTGSATAAAAFGLPAAGNIPAMDCSMVCGRLVNP